MSDDLLETCHECAEHCERCERICDEDREELARICIDCAQLCWLISFYISRQSPHVLALTELAARLCDECADECTQYDDDECQDCAETCRQSAAQFARILTFG
ncbi:MAG TPA: hypothetical protein VL282_11485 [Tepidisphaeraceae bacterium]|nr:hypothetical protein [Tepidisphaeraceae bacterium]